MKRIGMTWRVNPEVWDEYKDIHLNPWPELIEALQEVGIHNYSIYAFGTRVFAYMEVEGDDPGPVFERLQQTDTKKRWDEKVLPWVLPEAEEGTDVQFLLLEEIFYSP